MTPQEKAKELIDKFYMADENFPSNMGWMCKVLAKQCALIAVELRLDANFEFSSIEYGEGSLEYWEQVKQALTSVS